MGGAELSSDQVSALAAYIWGLSHRSPTTANPPVTSSTGAGIPAQHAPAVAPGTS